MAIPKIKATYSLDVTTVRALERLSARWKVNKSEVVRRAIHQAERADEPMNDAIAALDALQQHLVDEETNLEDWAEDIRQARLESDKARRDRHPS